MEGLDIGLQFRLITSVRIWWMAVVGDGAAQEASKGDEIGHCYRLGKVKP